MGPAVGPWGSSLSSESIEEVLIRHGLPEPGEFSRQSVMGEECGD